MRIYHGGSSIVITPEIRQSVNAKDFGQGFYCTELREQAERWAKRFSTPIVTVYEYMEQSGLDTLSFSSMSDGWLDFIVSCRSGQAHQHDVVAGAMADDQVWNYVADFISGILTREQFWVLAKFKYPTQQIVFCTEKAMGNLEYVDSYEVK